MKETDKKRSSNNKQGKRPSKSENCGKNLKVEEIDVKASAGKQKSNILVSDSNMGSESSEVYNNMVIDYVDDVYRSEEALDNSKTLKMVEKEIEKLNDHSSDLDSEPRERTAEESDPGTNSDSVSSRGDPLMADEKLEKALRVPEKLAKNESSDSSHAPRVKFNQKTNSLQIKASKASPKKATKPNKGPSKSTIKNSTDNSRTMKVHPKPLSEISGRVDDKALEEVMEEDILNEVSNGAHSVCSDDELVSNEENGENECRAAVDQKIEEMENRIEKLEEELKEVAVLEISLYSVVPEHSNSAHKVHTPARRLSRLYIHACKYWSQVKRATIARNTVSGLVLVAKSCGNDVSRLTFWLSNTVALREILSQTFGSSCLSSSLTKMVEPNEGGKKSDPKSPSFIWKNNSGSRHPSKQGFLQFVDDWQETRTLTAALEKVESWIFSRIVESIWWQTLTPNMQSPTDYSTTNKAVGRLHGPALGDQQQGNFSINLWRNAFHDAFKRLCPIRSGGHECGCLPVLARKVMEQCVGRLDVAMFNAILRESAQEIPTDPISDPIVDSKVLPIPAGDLSFGSGAQLKNSVGNWARWLTNSLGMDADGSVLDGKNSSEDDDRRGSDEPECFSLLNALSDLLMLPKDMLMDRSIRMEVCPSISLSLVKRILCNFTPDEFCPDPVPGAVLEALNAECIIERRLSGESGSSFPYTAAPVVYTPPSSFDVAEKIGEGGGIFQLSPRASFIQRKGYTSDEELDELESCLTSVIIKMPSSPTTLSNGNGNHHDQSENMGANARYKLLREVWMAT